MDIFDIEFELVNGIEGRAIVKAESAQEAKELLQLGMLREGFSMDGDDRFDIVETDLLKEEGPKGTIIGINDSERVL